LEKVKNSLFGEKGIILLGSRGCMTRASKCGEVSDPSLYYEQKGVDGRELKTSQG